MSTKSHQSILLFLFLLLLSPAAAQPPTPTDNSNYYGGYTGSLNSTVSAIIIVLVISLFLLAFFSIYIRNCSSSSSSNGPLRLSATHTARSRAAPIGLPPSLIASFPTFDYSAVKSLHIGKGALECAVCLTEFEDDDTLRLLPKCDHVFHPDCIDTWLVSHTTCPVCRADLNPQSEGESVRATNLGDIPEAGPVHVDNDSIIDVMEQPLNPAPLPSPLNRSRTRRSSSGRPKWVAMLARSNSTGHVAFRGGEDVERFTLRLTEDVRREIMSGKLNRNNSSVIGGSSRRGPRAGLSGPGGEGSGRGRMFGSWAGRSDRWGFSMAPPFFTRGASVKSPKVAEDGGGDGGLSVRSSKAEGRVHASTVSDTNLPPV